MKRCSGGTAVQNIMAEVQVCRNGEFCGDFPPGEVDGDHCSSPSHEKNFRCGGTDGPEVRFCPPQVGNGGTDGVELAQVFAESIVIVAVSERHAGNEPVPCEQGFGDSVTGELTRDQVIIGNQITHENHAG